MFSAQATRDRPNENVKNIHKYMQLKEIVDFKTDLYLALLHFKLCTNNIDDLENDYVTQQPGICTWP